MHMVELFGYLLAVYNGGDPYQPQEYKLKRGVDVVVATPGRIKGKLRTLRKFRRFSSVPPCDHV
ncbi:hypothetical protein Bca101_012498 [Brassica carinata]